MDEKSTAEILRVANDTSNAFRGTLTDEERAALDAKHENEAPSAAYAVATREDATIEFTIDALQTLGNDMQSILDRRMEKLYREALEVYYATEELAAKPEHAHLREQLEAMRAAHERQYGCPPPPRE